MNIVEADLAPDLPDLLAEHRSVVDEFRRVAVALTPVQWRAPREAGKWTPAQEATHLVLTYRAYATELQRGPEVTPATYPSRIEGFRERMLPRILKGNWFPLGGVAPGMAVPPEDTGVQGEVIAEMASAAREFEAALSSALAHNPNRFARHPYFGALSLPELLKVLTEHTRHHMSFLPQ